MAYGKTDAAHSRKRADEAGRGFKPRVCKERMFKKVCKYCKEVLKLRNSDDEAENVLASECRAKGTYYIVIFDLLDKEAGRQIYASNITNWKTLCEMLPDKSDDEDDNIDYTNLDKPHAIVMKKSGKGKNTDYTLTVSPNPTKFPPSLLKKKPINLDKILEILEAEEVPLWTPKTGKNKILVFPPWSETAKDFFKEIFYHWGVERLGLAAAGAEDEDPEDDDDYGDETEKVGVDEDENGTAPDPDDPDEDEIPEPDLGDPDDPEEPEWDDMTAKDLRILAKKEKLRVEDIDEKKGEKLRKAVKRAWHKKHD